jgi:hypothetical protein
MTLIDDSWSVIDDSRSVIDDSRSVIGNSKSEIDDSFIIFIYDHHVFIVHATGETILSTFCAQSMYYMSMFVTGMC